MDGRGTGLRAGYLRPGYWPTWAVLGLIRVCARLPRRVALHVGGRVGDLFFRVNEKRRNIARINVALCFPQFGETQREEMVRNHFRAYGRNIMDLGLIWWASERRLSDLTELDGRDILDSLKAQARNVILFTPHTVGIDMGGVVVSGLYPAVSMMKPLNDPVLNHFVLRGRLRYPTSTMVMREQGLRPLIRAVRGGKIGYFMPDQDFGADRSVFAPFFGIPTATLPVLGRMAGLADAVAVPCFTRLEASSGRYVVSVRPPLADFPTGDPVVDAARMNAELEAGIRMAPEQYMWTLRWFKTRPGNAPSPYPGVT